MNPALIEETLIRVKDKVLIGDGCWEWTAAKTDGYGIVCLGRNERAHRAIYELLVGPIPEGLQLDHLCRNRSCVNPKHLEPVTHAVNSLRGVGAPAVNAKKTHCPNGHPLAGPNLRRRSNGRRECLTCHREYMARYLPEYKKRHSPVERSEHESDSDSSRREVIRWPVEREGTASAAS